MWFEEEPFIEDFQNALSDAGITFKKFIETPRSIHCLLKPIEDGVFESFSIGKTYQTKDNLGLIPGRLSLHSYEDAIAKSWSDAFMGKPPALRIITSIRNICLEAEKNFGYKMAIIDTSPSLGMLNRVIISTSTGFFVPCMPDMFSTFGITNIGQALKNWKNQFNTMYSLLSDRKRDYFPKDFVKFLGFTIYNARKYTGQNDLNLAAAHYSYVKQLPNVINRYIPKECYEQLKDVVVAEPIGGQAVMHSHNTLPSMAQKYRVPMWEVPNLENLLPEDVGTISGNRKLYYEKRDLYHSFADDLLARIEAVEG
ncbi:ParA family protein [Desulfotignum phosphitoxidans]|uniref:Cobyrinic acid a,c-diamide synthase n=1 Tax=Desulfotignum phosphitoxidans DSM 13687 TaxID=1286635 RepID=S0FYN1_9BACT|nr:AAA family ATPase [Desulfotignum phosphitoxidans]EMS79785.1 cobyrinic acid a,c-diamide synthase [Desulfotignum phosphitoxidans DSM 13687]